MTSPSALVNRLRDDLAELRAARHARTVLDRELATYTTTSDIDDLLTLIGRDETRTAETMRNVLMHNRIRATRHAS